MKTVPKQYQFKQVMQRLHCQVTEICSTNSLLQSGTPIVGILKWSHFASQEVTELYAIMIAHHSTPPTPDNANIPFKGCTMGRASVNSLSLFLAEHVPLVFISFIYIHTVLIFDFMKVT